MEEGRRRKVGRRKVERKYHITKETDSLFILKPCLSYCSIRQLKRRYLIEGLLIVSEDELHVHHGREYGSRQAGMVLEE